MIRKLALTVAAGALATAPVVAQAATAPLAPATASVSEESELGGGIGPAFIIIGLAAIGMLVLILDEDDEDFPDSPISI